ALQRATGLITATGVMTSHGIEPADRATATQALASAALWSGRPQVALDQLLVVLEQQVDTDDSVHAAPSFMLAARAAADLAHADRGTGSQSALQLRTILVSLLRRCRADPFERLTGPKPRVAH